MYKQVLHDHLDGGLRPSTAKELAKHMNYKPINEIDNVANFLIDLLQLLLKII